MLDELMQHVSKGWYRFHWIVWVILNLAFLALYIVSRKFPELNLETTYGLNDAVLYMSVGILVYLLTFYWVVAKASLALASFVGSLMMVLPFMNVFNETNQSPAALVFVITWFLTGWIVSMHGFVISLGAMLVSFIYILLEIEFDFSNLKPVGLFLILGAMVVALFSYFFWRNRFISESSERVKKLSVQIKSHEQQLEILVQSITDGIIAVDTAGRITLINAAAAKLTAWPENEAFGFDATAVLRLIKDPKSKELLKGDEHPFSQVLKRHNHFSKTMLMIDRQNNNMYISLAISPVIVDKANKLSGAVAVFRDVSKEKQEEQQRAEFISTASHEMRTPVAAIEGYLALALNERVSKIDSKAREYLTKAHLSTQHLGKLFQDLLTSAKAEDGRLASHPEVVEVGQFITQLSEDLKFSAEKKGLKMELVINMQDSESGVIDASSSLKSIQPLYFCLVDPDRVREVITNVFDNAVKYTSEGRITIGLTGNDQVVQIKITDTGPGIPDEDLPHLFQKFYRVDNSATRSIGGTGLGLFICKKIVELYNGNIWAESKMGEGSTFYVNFPRLSSDKAGQLKNSARTSTKA
ncbi:MAG TPA: ATP-binding protein [Candidatus Saccharimonadales bacterium]|nr:ATP-binding protein [Candidatus Saccharimonadales bacterium]